MALTSLDLNPVEGMKTVNVNKSELLEILKKNRQEHQEVFREANEKFRKEAATKLEAMMKDLREGKAFNPTVVNILDVPEDHTAEYDRAIQMLEMSVDAVVAVDAREFACLVQDRWDWSRRWAASNIKYVNANSRSYGKLAALSGDD